MDFTRLSHVFFRLFKGFLKDFLRNFVELYQDIFKAIFQKFLNTFSGLARTVFRYLRHVKVVKLLGGGLFIKGADPILFLEKHLNFQSIGPLG